MCSLSVYIAQIVNLQEQPEQQNSSNNNNNNDKINHFLFIFILNAINERKCRKMRRMNEGQAHWRLIPLDDVSLRLWHPYILLYLDVYFFFFLEISGKVFVWKWNTIKSNRRSIFWRKQFHKNHLFFGVWVGVACLRMWAYVCQSIFCIIFQFSHSVQVKWDKSICHSEYSIQRRNYLSSFMYFLHAPRSLIRRFSTETDKYWRKQSNTYVQSCRSTLKKNCHVDDNQIHIFYYDGVLFIKDLYSNKYSTMTVSVYISMLCEHFSLSHLDFCIILVILYRVFIFFYSFCLSFYPWHQ